MFGEFSVVVNLLSLWQAVRYWTFHARERSFDFVSQRLTYRYPDFLERSRQVNAFVAHDFSVSRLQLVTKIVSMVRRGIGLPGSVGIPLGLIKRRHN